MELPTYFKDFLSNIRLTETQCNDLKHGHEILRDRLSSDPLTKDFIITTFLQGSYRRHTAVRPKTDDLGDVDVVVVTNFDKEKLMPEQAMKKFLPFMEKYYKDKYEFQSRSIGIKMSTIKLDLVPTSLPSEGYQELLRGSFLRSSLEESYESAMPSDYIVLNESANVWQDEPLWIPDRDLKKWETTHPLAQIFWTTEKNNKTSGHYVNVVKCLKWWRRVTSPKPKYPKSYPLEHLIGQSCPDMVKSVAEGIVKTLEDISVRYLAFAQAKKTPFLADHGVPTHDVFARVTGKDFAEFHSNIVDASIIARQAFDSDDIKESADLWRKLFGSKFPEAPDTNSEKKGGFSPRTNVSELQPGRFA